MSQLHYARTGSQSLLLQEEDYRKKQAEEEGKQLHEGLSSVPLPKPPPLPAGPKPAGMLHPPAAPLLPAGPAPTATAAAAAATAAAGPSNNAAGAPALPPPPGAPPGTAAAAAVGPVPALPPPPGPPPGAVLPPPPGPPPGMYGAAAGGMLPPPPGPPPAMQQGMLPPPAMPPPVLPPPAIPPPGSILPAAAMPPPASILPPPGMPLPSLNNSTISAAPSVTKQRDAAAAAASKAAGATTITGASTVARRPLAHKDKALTSMVPASVLIRREAAAKSKATADDEVRIGPGFGLAPVQKSALQAAAGSRLGVQPSGGQQQQGKWGSAVQSVVLTPSNGRAAAAGAGKAPGVDAKLQDFMESLKGLGAFE
eukprot:GHRR01014991.1.p1 GENE.GHRR01014991.1~~GHRR01014991.1.p1  ORF type:complete len:368 (+),score=178.15 GHRR01014991.1:865-1968(+)